MLTIICPGCNEKVLLRDFALSIEHCDDCEVQASIAMQHELDEAEAEEMAHYFGEQL